MVQLSFFLHLVQNFISLIVSLKQYWEIISHLRLTKSCLYTTLFTKKYYLFIWLSQLLVATCGVFFFLVVACVIWSFPGGAVVNNLPANAGDARFDPWVRKIPWRREIPWTGERSRWATVHGGLKVSDTTEQLSTHM